MIVSLDFTSRALSLLTRIWIEGELWLEGIEEVETLLHLSSFS